MRHAGPALKVVTYLASQRPKITLSKLQILLLIAQRQDVACDDLTKLTGLNQTTVWRCTGEMGDKSDRAGNEGLGWISIRPDPEDPRRDLFSLSRKGRYVFRELEAMFG